MYVETFTQKMRFCVFSLIALLLFSQSAALADGFDVSSPSAILIDGKTGRVLYEKNADQRMFPASTTKIMTALLVLENCDNLDETFAVSTNAVKIPSGSSNIGLRAGEVLTIRQYLYGLLLSSGNDAANVLGEYVSGSIENFVGLMNSRAKELGMNGTNFVTPHGTYDENHYTTARDLSKLAFEAMKSPTFREIVKTVRYTIPPTEKYKEPRYLNNTNQMINPYKGRQYLYSPTIGIKTGYTKESNHVFAGAAQKGDSELICVVMGASIIDGRTMSFVDAKSLFAYGFDNFTVQTITKKGDYVAESTIKNAKGGKNILLEAGDDVKVLLSNDSSKDEVTKKISISENIKAPVAKGTVLGEAEYYYNNTLIGKVNLVASRDYEFDPLLFVLNGALSVITSPWFYLPLILILCILIVLRQKKYMQRKRRRLQKKLQGRNRYI